MIDSPATAASPMISPNTETGSTGHSKAKGPAPLEAHTSTPSSNTSCTTTLKLDTCGKYEVCLRVDVERQQLSVALIDKAPALQSDDSVVNNILASSLRLRVNGTAYQFQAGDQDLGSIFCKLPMQERNLKIEIELAGKPLTACLVDLEAGAVLKIVETHQLHAFDVRNFTTQGERYLEQWSASAVSPGYRPLVDLHSHFAGQVSSTAIVEAGLRVDARYPVHLLKLARLDVAASKGTSEIPLRSLSQPDKQKLIAAMHIEPTRIATFEDMEVIYKLRSPITKNLDVFPELLRDIATAYRERGVRYSELSLSDIVQPEWIAKAHQCLPRIEQETGVRIRFLVGFWRHNPEEFNLDLVDKTLAAAAHSPYIVGADFMGHETNSTLAFRDIITSKHPWSPGEVLTDPRTGAPRGDGLLEFREKYPYFQIRVHSGENPVSPENVREAILAGATRVGHGLYGLDDATRKLAADRGVIVEFNCNGNRALNNVDGLSARSEFLITSYVNAGVRVTFGTDGSIYGGGGKAETYIGSLAGVTQAQLEEIGRSDADYRKQMHGAFVNQWNRMINRCIDIALERAATGTPPPSLDQLAALRHELDQISVVGSRGPVYQNAMTPVEKALWPAFEERILRAGNYGLPPANQFPKSTFDWSEWSAAKEARVSALRSALAQQAIPLHDEEQLNTLLAGRTPILVSGASASSWPKISDKAAVRTFLRNLVAYSDPQRAVFITGATHFGVEEELHQIVKQENNRRATVGLPTFTVLGTVVEETKANEVGPITDAVLLGDRWYAKSAKVLNFVREHSGHLLFVGGGNILNDEIQAAWNIGVNFYLMDGPEGASTTKAMTYCSHAFRDYASYIERLNQRNVQPPTGASP